MLPETLPALLAHLQAHPDVVGLISFGSQPRPNQPVAGDFDLFVVLTQTDLAIRSLHFCLGNRPIDLNLITLDELEHLTPADSFRYATLRDSMVLHDPLGIITPALRVADGSAEVGYRMAQKVTGRGLATAAVHMVCELAATKYGLTRLRARVTLDNPASRKVLERNGFVAGDSLVLNGKPAISYTCELR